MKNIFTKIQEILNHYPSYRYKQVCHNIFTNRKSDFNLMTDLPKDIRELLIQNIGNIVKLNLLKEDSYNFTTKYLFELEDHQKIETVLMKFKGKPNTKSWNSLCISSQVGCPLGCKFCATGRIGFIRNLTTDEIISQVLYLKNLGIQVNNILFMGMGEPLLNPNIIDSIKIFTDPQLFNIGQRKISVSTVGIVPKLQDLYKEFPQINIAFSLHAPTNTERAQIMPINKEYKIEQVFATLDKHIQKNKRKVFIVYMLMKGVNDSPEHAQQLADLINKRPIKNNYLYHINLISYNFTGNQLNNKTILRTSKSQIETFQKVLNQNNIPNTLRQSFGNPINAACGQLYAGYQQK